ncbi:YggS family pyridoxal phosphate-dependent enzyme [Vitreoscilla massiliensis]|uniref:Pyridoxal phosphate homeostasis protein n=1 Tax=Vitreoscilla massiliensis TaxID=1689272 RepID=A0ABY4E5J7_9NEIS|nr:YggS family pyridoxal phosphate-dependent enzyme [Vitreoscilla massiliensis]UOO91051.1 YggS family pyridoxal phosphate-dependent enzyme [Vitreoscilla massiliensis]
MSQTTLIERYQTVIAHIKQLSHQYRQDETAVTLIAVSKTFPSDDIRTLYQQGQRHFGENYIQEWSQKTEQLSDLDIDWHIIGQIQSNKSRIVAEKAAWVHTIDREKIARRLSEQRPTECPPLNVCIEVNTSGSADKHGVMAADVLNLAQQVSALPQLRLRGLMCVPSHPEDAQQLQQEFALMQQLFKGLQAANLDVDTLSMGMSADMEQAIAAGATHVRIGSAIFGQR